MEEVGDGRTLAGPGTGEFSAEQDLVHLTSHWRLLLQQDLITGVITQIVVEGGEGGERGEAEVGVRRLVPGVGADYHRMSLYVRRVWARVSTGLQSVDVLRLGPEDPRLDGGHDGLAVGVGESCKAGQVVQGRHGGDGVGVGLEEGGEVGDVGSVRGLEGVTAGDGAEGVGPRGGGQGGHDHVGVVDGLADELCMVVELEVWRIINFISFSCWCSPDRLEIRGPVCLRLYLRIESKQSH